MSCEALPVGRRSLLRALGVPPMIAVYFSLGVSICFALGCLAGVMAERYLHPSR